MNGPASPASPTAGEHTKPEPAYFLNFLRFLPFSHTCEEIRVGRVRLYARAYGYEKTEEAEEVRKRTDHPPVWVLPNMRPLGVIRTPLGM